MGFPIFYCDEIEVILSQKKMIFKIGFFSMFLKAMYIPLISAENTDVSFLKRTLVSIYERFSKLFLLL